jgi:hypothetical protein
MAKGDWKIWMLIVIGVAALGLVVYGIWYAIHQLDDHGLLERALVDARSQ